MMMVLYDFSSEDRQADLNEIHLNKTLLYLIGCVNLRRAVAHMKIHLNDHEKNKIEMLFLKMEAT